MSDETKGGLLDRTLRNLHNAWQNIAGSQYDAEAASMRPHLPDDDIRRLREQMQACLDAKGGEVSARARAAALGRAYLNLDEVGRQRFLRVLAEDFDVDEESVNAAIDAVRTATDGALRRKAETNLQKALAAPRVRLLTQFIALPEGMKFLVDMRAELLSLARKDAIFRPVEADLKRLLTSWFDVGLLELHQITWDSAPASLLERLIAYEAVHAIQSWDDLKNRLAPDRRCFAYFHPRMPDEPLIFVQVALVDGLAGNVQELLDEQAPAQDPQKADTAIFYSISNAQKGLAGISFGNFLIKRVVDSLSAEYKGIKTFATLSPIPGFRAWLEREMSEDETAKKLAAEPDWHQNPEAAEALRTPMMRLCARYLAKEKRAQGTALDPVAHFHLTNGARLERLNWMADTSETGLQRAGGMMVNYLYKLGDIDANHEAYRGAGKVVASQSIKGLAKK